MPKNVVIYNQIACFAGPSPASGYHFIDQDGNLANNDNSNNYFNLVFPINRIFQVSYGWNESRTDIKSLGKYSTIARPILIQPDITLSFSYYLMGLINEARLGFVINQPSGFSGVPIYGQSLNVCPISGLIDRTYQRSNETPIGWPLTTREPRNLFIATNKGYDDINDYTGNYIYKSNNIDVFAFGDCYLNSYKTSAAINQIPYVSVDFICSNVSCYNGGSGNNIPSIDPKTYSLRTGIIFNLPNNFQGNNLPTVLLPCDISLDINSIPSGDYLACINNNTLSTLLDSFGRRIAVTQDKETVNLPINLNDIKIQSYNIDLTLNREPLYNIGYKAPMDRCINFPVFANINFSILVGDNVTGSLIKYITKDREYDINVKLSYQNNTLLYSGTAILYRFWGSKFNSINFSEGVGQYRTVNLSFTTEIKPDNTIKGFFMSGQLGVFPLSSLIGSMLGDDFDNIGEIDELLTEDGGGIILSDTVNQPLY